MALRDGAVKGAALLYDGPCRRQPTWWRHFVVQLRARRRSSHTGLTHRLAWLAR